MPQKRLPQSQLYGANNMTARTDANINTPNDREVENKGVHPNLGNQGDLKKDDESALSTHNIHYFFYTHRSSSTCGLLHAWVWVSKQIQLACHITFSLLTIQLY